MNETESIPLTPHPFILCDGWHLFERRAQHCAVCEFPRNHPIHAEAVAA